MNLELSGVQVLCPNCGDIYYETTETYDPVKMTTGDMLRFTKKYGPQGYNWSLPFSDHDMSEGLLCVECGGDMAPSGYLKLDRLVFDAAGLGKPLEEEDLLVKDLSGTAIIAMQAASLKMSPEEYERMALQIKRTLVEKYGLPTDKEQTQEANKDSLVLTGDTEEEDPLAKYLTQKACPECGRFFGVDEWEAHLSSHPPEVRAEILKKPEPEQEADSRIGVRLPAGKNKGKGKGWFKGQKSITEIMEAEEPIGTQCPFCESTFEHNPEFEAHIKTHDLGGVQQATTQ